MPKNKHAQALAKKRSKSLTPERRKEIASIAGKASVIARKSKKTILSLKHPSHGNT